MCWRPEPISCATLPDELWLEEKFQSNSDIAGSPRNSFRASLVMEPRGRALNGIEGEILSIPTKLRILGTLYNGSQTAGAKLR
jgi:hypothetical protein